MAEEIMKISEREKIHYRLLEALYKARKQVEYLEAALAHNAAYLGTGVEREDFVVPPSGRDSGDLPEELLNYLGLVGHEPDISDYLGRDGDAASRPRLSEDAPDSVRPRTGPRVGRLVGQLALGHPDDGLPLPGLSGGPGAARPSQASQPGATEGEQAPEAEKPPATPTDASAPASEAKDDFRARRP